MFEMEKKLSVSALAVIPSGGSQATVGAKLRHHKSDITVFGGYGDMTALSSPYTGNSGMTMPGMNANDVMGHQGGSAFIGVSWNALPTLRKLFGGK